MYMCYDNNWRRGYEFKGHSGIEIISIQYSLQYFKRNEINVKSYGYWSQELRKNWEMWVTEQKFANI